ncbi:HNH endonuclease [Anaerorhabdus sp.]|uniref:HNH endonuclease n=1 Tax=Anaerorhabdus sp. TaxID=1872524 RepID=UPI002FC9A18E
MAKEYSKHVYKSKIWEALRIIVIEREHGLCQMCGDPGNEVDHIIEITPMNVNDVSIIYNVDNLQLLCHTCHTKKTKNSLSTENGLMFDENGDLISR